MDPNELLPLVALIVVVWVTLAFATVTLVRMLYQRWVQRLMEEQRGNEPRVEVAHPGWAPPVVSREIVVQPGADPFAALHRRRLLIFCAGSLVYAVAFGLAWECKIALEDESFQLTWAMVTSPDVLFSASKLAFVLLVPTLLLLRVRRFQYQASGIWAAALILISLPMGKLSLQMSSTDLSTLVLRAALGVGAAFAYLRFNAWRAERSSWSFPARGLHAFFAAFSLTFAVFSGLAGHWLTGLLFLLAYPARQLSLRLMFTLAHRQPKQRLLFLRVFGRGAQTDRFYRALAHDWSMLGPVRLIGAADLATRTMSPQLLTAFVNGSLRAAFHWTAHALAARVARADQPLLDLSYRTVEVLCSGETWREAVRQLIHDADVVVMDLRDFQKENAGCAWEIGQLVNMISLRRVLLCVNGNTHAKQLHQALLTAWRSIQPTSPNWQTLEPFQILDVSRNPSRVSAHAFGLAAACGTLAYRGIPAAREQTPLHATP
jgi:hypothetical protein